MSARSARRALLAALVAAAVATGTAAEAGPANLSSHEAAFFSDLLSGRVWVHERPHSALASDRGTVWAIHHGADGVARACIRLDGVWQARTGRWRVVPSPRFRALYNYIKAGTEPDPAHARGHVPVFYDPETGRLHSESLRQGGSSTGSPGDWFVLALGWVQESWPRALKDACPGLELPAGLPVNERQTSRVMEEAVAQDPDAALRAWPGSGLLAPGSTGLALAAGGPTVTADELGRFLAANHGHVLESPAGVRLVLVLGSEGDELWRLDAEGEVSDTALLLPAADGEQGRSPVAGSSPAGIVVQWERLPQRQEYRVGDPFPLRPTGVRHEAFVLTDRLVAAGVPVDLPFGDGGSVALRFAEGGIVAAQSVEGDEIGGRWWWSRGRLHVALDGSAEVTAWPWRGLAALRPEGRLNGDPDAAGARGGAE